MVLRRRMRPYWPGCPDALICTAPGCCDEGTTSRRAKAPNDDTLSTGVRRAPMTWSASPRGPATGS